MIFSLKLKNSPRYLKDQCHKSINFFMKEEVKKLLTLKSLAINFLNYLSVGKILMAKKKNLFCNNQSLNIKSKYSLSIGTLKSPKHLKKLMKWMKHLAKMFQCLFFTLKKISSKISKKKNNSSRNK